MLRSLFLRSLVMIFLASVLQPFSVEGLTGNGKNRSIDALKKAFLTPPDSVKPGVYWYFMDGNLSATGITRDLESMKQAGIGSVIFLEVNVGIPRGPVTFLSPQWQQLFHHAIQEARRLGIALTLGSGPGWAGSGGPWVDAAHSMQHLVAADTVVTGPTIIRAKLPLPAPKKPYFGYGTLTDSLRKLWDQYYQDIALLAFPSPESKVHLPGTDEKALYYRAPYSSVKGVRPFLPTPVNYPVVPSGAVIHPDSIRNLTAQLSADGMLEWRVPIGKWTLRRLGLRNNGAVTRPAPQPGLGFECDKMDTTAFNLHFEAFMGKLLAVTGGNDKTSTGGWKMIHIDSWEMGAQNWAPGFREEFAKRRGYDPLPYLLTYQGTLVGSAEISERFLWDVRQTAQELVIQNHARHFRELGRRHGFRLSIEPYDMNPTADLELGAVADVPMCEFWSRNYGYNTSFSAIEATSVAHLEGKPVVQAEAFTAEKSEGWKLYPGAIKDQGDWAFAAGINKFYYHTFAHQPLDEKLKPGMTMGPYGVHWDRNQTWWEYAYAYHRYIARCSYLLQQGKTVADLLYLTPEGAPHVFRPPLSATVGNDTLPDRRGFNFDGCPPGVLMAEATVVDHKVCFPNGGSYRLLVLPLIETMTPALLNKIKALVEAGAYVAGIAPRKSPGLSGYPRCDKEVADMAADLWKNHRITDPDRGEGGIFALDQSMLTDSMRPYPSYETTAQLLHALNVTEDFATDGPVRYTHRTMKEVDLYFLSNRSNEKIHPQCSFRCKPGTVELWNPLTGEIRPLGDSRRKGDLVKLPLEMEPPESYFVVFRSAKGEKASATGPNFVESKVIRQLTGSWRVEFDPKWGGPATIRFDSLTDWAQNQAAGIRYYSGKARYKKTFVIRAEEIKSGRKLFIDPGEVAVMAHVKVNGQDAGVIWTQPGRLEITPFVQSGSNELEITVVNCWPNRLIGDEFLPDDGIRDHKWPDWMEAKQERSSGRLTYATWKFYKKESPLLKSGLLGPVTIVAEESNGSAHSSADAEKSLSRP
ncbi:MAG: hypothetical protein LWW85_00090 [Marinilabiliales bacterium]|nr:hypothetical protein [Marinilabiliales bacterium]